VLVVNTCALHRPRQAGVVDTILEMAELKKQVPGRGWWSPAAWPSGIATS
jgi:hypothetical protein